jgi:eukaryotic-like serine/threonine-protein kinase
VIGESVGNFEIVSRIGKGGMGEVWLAEQKSVRTRVAIKMLSAEASGDAQQKKRLFNEAIAVSKIPHAGIVKIFDVGEHHGRAYLAMEYLEGETLTARIQRAGVLAIREVADFGRQIASVLDAAHAAGITHRDLKPDNIYLVHDAELGGARVKILDFGIAKLQNAAMTAMSVSSMGTPNYMSPEQWHSLAQVDWRTDAYSLGCVAFEMACGRPPFVAQSLGEAAQLHMLEPPPVPSSVVPGLPSLFDELVLRLLDKELPPRPTMKDTMAAFAALANGQPYTLPGSPRAASQTMTRPSVVNAPADSAGVFLSASASAMPAAPSVIAPASMLDAPQDAGTASLRMPVQRETPPPRKSRAWPFVVAGLVLVAGIAAAAVTLQARSEAQTPVAEAKPAAPAVAPTAEPRQPPRQPSPQPPQPPEPPANEPVAKPPQVEKPAPPPPQPTASSVKTPTPAPPSVDGGKPVALSAKDIEAAVNRNRKNILACSRLNVSGVVDVTVHVAPDSRSSIETTSGMADVDACLAAAIARVRFPATQRGGSTTMSFDLVPPRQSTSQPPEPSPYDRY